MNYNLLIMVFKGLRFYKNNRFCSLYLDSPPLPPPPLPLCNILLVKFCSRFLNVTKSGL